MALSVEPAETAASSQRSSRSGPRCHLARGRTWPRWSTSSRRSPGHGSCSHHSVALPVATGVGKPSSIGDAMYTMVRVLPGYRRAGVGTAVLAALSRHAQTVGLGSLLGRVREDDKHRGASSSDAASSSSRASVRRSRPHAFRRSSARAAGRRRDREPWPSGPIWCRPRTRWRSRRSATSRSVPRRRPRGRSPSGGRTRSTPRARSPALSLIALDGDDVVGWSGILAARRRRGRGREPPHRGPAQCPWSRHRNGVEARAGPPGEGGRAAPDRDDERRGQCADARRQRPARLRGRAGLAAHAWAARQAALPASP